MGAVPLASAVAAVSHAGKQPVNAFFVRKQAKEHGTQSLIEGLPNGDSLKGKRVVIVEDVTTTGGSAIKAAEAVRAEGRRGGRRRHRHRPRRRRRPTPSPQRTSS